MLSQTTVSQTDRVWFSSRVTNMTCSRTWPLKTKIKKNFIFGPSTFEKRCCTEMHLCDRKWEQGDKVKLLLNPWIKLEWGEEVEGQKQMRTWCSLFHYEICKCQCRGFLPSSIHPILWILLLVLSMNASSDFPQLSTQWGQREYYSQVTRGTVQKLDWEDWVH